MAISNARILAFSWILAVLYPSLAAAQTRLQATFAGLLISDKIGSSRLSNPLGMAADPEGSLYIADTGNHRLIKCDANGLLVLEIGGFGFGSEQFDRPVDIWAGNSLDVLVADYNNQRLQRYDKHLNFISSYLSSNDQENDLQFGYPAAVALSPQGELFVADHEFNRLLRIDSFGETTQSFGDFNWGDGRLDRPAKILISSAGELLVSDSTRHAIMIYDGFGNFLGAIGETILQRPAGMAEWQGMILVADRGLQKIIALNRDGDVLGEFGSRGTELHELSQPSAVVLAQSSNQHDSTRALALVLDSGNNRVSRFELSIMKTE